MRLRVGSPSLKIVGSVCAFVCNFHLVMLVVCLCCIVAVLKLPIKFAFCLTILPTIFNGSVQRIPNLLEQFYVLF